MRIIILLLSALSVLFGIIVTICLFNYLGVVITILGAIAFLVEAKCHILSKVHYINGIYWEDFE